MTMDEAEKLARKLKVMFASGMRSEEHDMAALCDYILSGDMKREIENAAFEHAIRVVDLRVGNFFDRSETKFALRALIRPPAQKENGK